MSDDSHFIKNIEINNFKCFQGFKADGFGRVNLIGGKNNVGKTAFMEAVYVNVYGQELPNFCFALNAIKFMRENLNILDNRSTYNTKHFIEQTDGIDIVTNKNNISFSIKEKSGIKEYCFKYKNQEINVNVNDFSFTMNRVQSISFIDNFGLFNSGIIYSYGFIQKKDKELYLNNILKEFDSQIEAFKIIDDKPQCKTNEGYREITEFGDEVSHLISIVVSLFETENGYLFIDEIDNGIHYTQLDRLWEVVILTSFKRIQCPNICHNSFKRMYRILRESQLKKLEDKDRYHFYEF